MNKNIKYLLLITLSIIFLSVNVFADEYFVDKDNKVNGVIDINKDIEVFNNNLHTITKDYVFKGGFQLEDRIDVVAGVSGYIFDNSSVQQLITRGIDFNSKNDGLPAETEIKDPIIYGEARDSEFRRFVDIEFSIEYLPKDSIVELVVELEDGSEMLRERLDDIEQPSKEPYLYKKRIGRRDDIDLIELVVSYGSNKKDFLADYNKTHQFTMGISSVYSHRNKVKVSTDEDYTKAILEVKNESGELVAIGEAIIQTKNTNTYIYLKKVTDPSEFYRLKSGDIVSFRAYKLDDLGNIILNYRTNPCETEVR